MNQELLSSLKELFPPERILIGEELNARYHHIWKMDEPLQAVCLVMPIDTKEVASVMKLCKRYEQTVVVHGGLTNLVGSTETNSTELVMSMEKMNKIEEVDTFSRSMTVQSGVILQQVQECADDHDLLFPLNFGAKGSAQIGGVISTNAGGLRVFRYGMTRSLVLGLEVVLADGTVISSLKKIIKDNSAYDLKHLFIGSEGTLGIVTRAVLKLVEKPISRCSAFVAIQDYHNVTKLLKFVDKKSGGILSGYELIWKEAFEVMAAGHVKGKSPIEINSPYFVLIEFLGSDPKKDFELLQNILEEALESALIEDASMAFTEADLDWFWGIREDVHTLVSHCKVDQHFDISLPIASIGDYVDKVRAQLLKNINVEHVFAFGHVADGNIHFIVGKKTDDQELTLWVNEIVYSPLKDLNGSVSAEHGIGSHKKKYLPLCRTDEEIALMKLLKKTLDPLNLLNRGKVLDL